jgi:hypothetical protein
MAADVDYVEALNQIADKNQRQLSEALITLENRITDLMATAPLKDGSLFDLEWAVKARADIRKLVEDEYLATVDDIVRQYGGVALDTQKMLETYGSFTKLDPEIIRQLQTLEFQGFQEVGTEYLDVVSREVYQNTLTGTSFAASIASVKAVQGGRLASNAKQLVHDSLMQFDAAVNTSIGKQSGATKWKYVGRIIETTRPFCREHEGQTFTEEEIATLWEGSWAGKASGDPFIVRGGYNCGHQFRPVFDEEDGTEEEVAIVAEPESQVPSGAPELLDKKVALDQISKITLKANRPVYDASDAGGYIALGSGKKLPPHLEKLLDDKGVKGEVFPVRFKPYGYKRGDDAEKTGNKQFGTIKTTGMSTETLSLLDSGLKEIDGISKQFKTPPIRGVVPVGGKRTTMAMGDGMLSINGSYWNPIAKQTYLPKDKLLKNTKSSRLALNKADEYYEKVQEEYRAAMDAFILKFPKYRQSDSYLGTPEYAVVQKKAAQLKVASADAAKARKKWDKDRRLSEVQPASVYVKGGNVEDRPWSAKQYHSDPADKFRSTLFHEFGHTVHQEYWRQVSAAGTYATPIEKYLRQLFYVNGRSGAINKNLFFPTSYSQHDPKEWWAENFSLYNMGRKDLVDDKLLGLMDEIVKSKGRIKVFDGWDFEIGDYA